jgi:hypothetical protein
MVIPCNGNPYESSDKCLCPTLGVGSIPAESRYFWPASKEYPLTHVALNIWYTRRVVLCPVWNRSRDHVKRFEVFFSFYYLLVLTLIRVSYGDSKNVDLNHIGSHVLRDRSRGTERTIVTARAVRGWTVTACVVPKRTNSDSCSRFRRVDGPKIAFGRRDRTTRVVNTVLASYANNTANTERTPQSPVFGAMCSRDKSHVHRDGFARARNDHPTSNRPTLIIHSIGGSWVESWETCSKAFYPLESSLSPLPPPGPSLELVARLMARAHSLNVTRGNSHILKTFQNIRLRACVTGNYACVAVIFGWNCSRVEYRFSRV